MRTDKRTVFIVDFENGTTASIWIICTPPGRTTSLAHPQIDVVLGADTVILGALSALRAAGKARQNQFLGGIDGEPKAVAEIKRGGPYKASVSLASPIF